jgi:hypothetical protein
VINGNTIGRNRLRGSLPNRLELRHHQYGRRHVVFDFDVIGRRRVPRQFVVGRPILANKADGDNDYDDWEQDE